MSKSSLAYFNIRLDFPTPLSPSTNILTVVLVVWSISIVGLPVQLLYYMDYDTWTYTHTNTMNRQTNRQTDTNWSDSLAVEMWPLI